MWISHALINHLLLQQPELKQALGMLSGRRLRLTAMGIQTDMLIREDGYVEALAPEQSTECQITLAASTWTKLLHGEPIGVGDVRIEGDSDLAMQALPIFGQLRYQPYADTSRLFGNTIASQLDHQMKQLAQRAQQMTGSIEGEVRDFMQERHSPLVNHVQWQQQSEAIDALSDDVARLQARLQRL